MFTQTSVAMKGIRIRGARNMSKRAIWFKKWATTIIISHPSCVGSIPSSIFPFWDLSSECFSRTFRGLDNDHLLSVHCWAWTANQTKQRTKPANSYTRYQSQSPPNFSRNLGKIWFWNNRGLQVLEITCNVSTKICKQGLMLTLGV